LEKDLNLQSNQVLALFNKSMRKFVKFLREVEKQRFVGGSEDKKATTVKKLEKGNVASTELDEKSDEEDENRMDDEDDEEEKDTSIENNKEIMALFESSGDNEDEDNDDERFRMDKKKRKASEMEDEEVDAEEIEQKTANKLKKVQRTKGNKKNPLIAEVMNNDEYKITGVNSNDLARGLENSRDGVVSVETPIESKKKEVKKYMLKTQKEQDQDKQMLDSKVFKKGGNKKRRVKK
jgi:hypothetical protein